MDTGSEGAFGSTLPTSSVFTIGDASETGKSENYVAYVWHNVEGFQKFGSYEGNNDNDGPFVYTGFRPRLLFLKAIDQQGERVIYDTVRKTINGGGSSVISWNADGAQSADDATRAVDLLSSGFKIRTSNITINNTNTFIYGAWADVPFKYNNAL